MNENQNIGRVIWTPGRLSAQAQLSVDATLVPEKGREEIARNQGLPNYRCALARCGCVRCGDGGGHWRGANHCSLLSLTLHHRRRRPKSATTTQRKVALGNKSRRGGGGRVRANEAESELGIDRSRCSPRIPMGGLQPLMNASPHSQLEREERAPPRRACKFDPSRCTSHAFAYLTATIIIRIFASPWKTLVSVNEIQTIFLKKVTLNLRILQPIFLIVDNHN